MRFEGLTIKKKAFKPRTTNSNHDFKKYPNLVKDVHESGLNQVWVGDITYIWIGEIRLPGHAVGSVLAQVPRMGALGRILEASGALRALNLAFACRKGHGLAGLIHHTDAGVQYACDAYIARLSRRGIVGEHERGWRSAGKRVCGVVQ